LSRRAFFNSLLKAGHDDSIDSRRSFAV